MTEADKKTLRDLEVQKTLTKAGLPAAESTKLINLQKQQLSTVTKAA